MEGCATDNCTADFTGLITSDFDTANFVQGCGLTGAITATYTVDDGCGNTAVVTAAFSIVDTIPPDLGACTGLDTIVDCNIASNEMMAAAWDSANIAVLGSCATDACDMDMSSQVTSDYDFVNFVADCGATGELVVVYSVSDDCGNSATIEATLTVIDTTAPEIIFTDPTIDSLANGATLQVQCFGQDPEWTIPVLDATSITVIDSCDTDPLIEASAVLIAEGDCADDGFIQQWMTTWVATDACGNSSTAEIIIELVDTVAPVLEGIPGDTTVSCDEIPDPAFVTATDECLCACDVEFTESMLDPGCLDGQILVRTWTVEDKCGNVAVQTQRITLVDEDGPNFVLTTPQLSGLRSGATLTYECNSGGIPDFFFNLSLGSAIITDACSGVADKDFNSDLYVPQHCEFEGFLERWTFEWSGIDLCGNEGAFVLYVELIDTVAPILYGVSDYVCSNDPRTIQVHAIDACTRSSVQEWDRVIPSPCGSGNAILRVYEARDACGNWVRDTSVIIENDNIAPEIMFVDPFFDGVENGDTIVMECEASDEFITGFDESAVELKDDCSEGAAVAVRRANS